MSGEPRRTTVSIPLHASAPWVDVVVGNVERLAGVARVVVSDATGADDALERVRDAVGTRPGVEFLGPRSLAAGWVAHSNDLLSRASTPYVMWLPHDDDIDADWVVAAERELDAHPDAVLAVGAVGSVVDRDGMVEHSGRIELDPRLTGGDAGTRMLAGGLEWLGGRGCPLGLLFRSVARREAAVPLPTTPRMARGPTCSGG